MRTDMKGAGMDTNVQVIAIVAGVILVALVVARQLRVKWKGPLGASLDMDASKHSPPPTPAATIEDSKSRKGGAKAVDKTGRGAAVRRTEVEKDIHASSIPPPSDSGPKT
jgi:hypothetical protein